MNNIDGRVRRTACIGEMTEANGQNKGNVCDLAERERLNEEMILSWVHLSALLKSSRITSGLAYNEAVVMLLLYNEYRASGKGSLPFSTIVEETRMLKSQANRTVAALEKRGFVSKQCSPKDKRAVYVTICCDRMEEFLAVHSQSLALADAICNIIGEEDARVFVRIVEKIVAHSGDAGQENL